MKIKYTEEAGGYWKEADVPVSEDEMIELAEAESAPYRGFSHGKHQYKRTITLHFDSDSELTFHSLWFERGRQWDTLNGVRPINPITYEDADALRL